MAIELSPTASHSIGAHIVMAGMGKPRDKGVPCLELGFSLQRCCYTLRMRLLSCSFDLAVHDTAILVRSLLANFKSPILPREVLSCRFRMKQAWCFVQSKHSAQRHGLGGAGTGD